MLSLYWKHDGQTRSLIDKSFKSEAEFERYVFDNQDILGGDIFIIHRQIRTGSKQGIPDMLGVDQDARVCIIELKNQEAGDDILPQALSYAIWAETNPDSIKAIWLESKQRPEDVEIDWDKVEIRVILIAPSFSPTVPRMAGKIGYPIELVQVRCYCFEDEEFLLVEVLEDESPKVSVTTVKGEWDWDFYESEHGKEATAQFRQAVEAVAGFVQRQGWNVDYNLNKYYTGFKLGNRLVFDVAWGGTYAWKIRCRLPVETAESFQGDDWELQSYDESYGAGVFRPVRPEAPDISELEPLLVEAYKTVSGSG